MSQLQQTTETMAHHTESMKPSTRNAIIELTSLDRYIGLRNHRMRFQDAFDINAERVDKANKQDVIFGRGKNLQDYPGNRRMRQITDKYKHLYRTLPKSQKRNLVETVYKEIVRNDTRFLTKAPNDKHYLLVDVEVALQKISNSLRCMKKHKRQLVVAMEGQNTAEEAVPKASVSPAAASSSKSEPSSQHQLASRVDADQFPPKKTLKAISILHHSSSNPFLGPRNHDMLITLQHLNQCRRLRLVMDARMMSSIAIGRSIRLPSAKQPMPTPSAKLPLLTKQARGANSIG